MNVFGEGSAPENSEIYSENNRKSSSVREATEGNSDKGSAPERSEVGMHYLWQSLEFFFFFFNNQNE